MPRKRKTVDKDSAVVETKKKKNEDDKFEKGDPVLCLLEYGVWWPGFIVDKLGQKLSVGFFNEENKSTKPLSKVKHFYGTSPLILQSQNILLKRKMDKTLVSKYITDVEMAKQMLKESVTTDVTNLVVNENKFASGDLDKLIIDASVSADVDKNVDKGDLDKLIIDASVSADVDKNVDKGEVDKILFVPVNEEATLMKDDDDDDDDSCVDSGSDFVPDSDDESYSSSSNDIINPLTSYLNKIPTIEKGVVNLENEKTAFSTSTLINEVKSGGKNEEQVCSTSTLRNEVESGGKNEEPVGSTSTMRNDNSVDISLPFESGYDSAVHLQDVTFPEVFTRKFDSTPNINSKFGRTYDRRHACFYCSKLLTNIQTHYEHVHKTEKEVMEIVDLKRENDKKKIKKIHQLQNLLRNKGDHNHNKKVCFHKKGEIILSRRREASLFDLTHYGPCPWCEEWVKLDNITKHKSSCACEDVPKSNEDYSKGSNIIKSKIMKGQLTTKPSPQLKREVFASMSRNRITDLAQNDMLIVSLGEYWLMKSYGNRLRRKNFTSFRMRLAARLLNSLKTTSGHVNAGFFDFIIPSFFDMVVECSLKACDENENEELLHPSTALKLGYDLTKLATIKLGYAIKNNDEAAKKDSSEFIKLIQLEWFTRVSKLANIFLQERRFNKGRDLPYTDDIVKLSKYLVSELTSLDLKNPTPLLFKEVVLLTESRLLMYNKRRPGELESLSINEYLKRPSLDETEVSLRQNLTVCEKQLLNSQDLVEIRGKTGRMVPLLVPMETKKALTFLSNSVVRELCGVKSTNHFMFANTGDTVNRAGEALNIIKERITLKYPERILATKLRKHTATVAQVLSLDEQQMKYICQHLGHTQKVHDLVYRQTSGLIERIDIAKLMLIQENNLIGKFSNKKLSEVQFEDIMSLTNEENDMTNDENGMTNDENGITNDENGIVNGEKNVEVSIMEDNLDFSTEPVKQKKQKQVIRIRWTQEEEEEIKTEFRDYFKDRKKTCPSQGDCKAAIKSSKEKGGLIWKRPWETLKKKVNNMLKKSSNCLM